MKYESLLSNTDSLMNQVYWFEQNIKSPRAASHRGVSIKHIDIKERRESFLRELKSTASSWVYSSDKYKDIFQQELKRRNGDIQNTQSYLGQLVESKFRKGYPQGQYGELLLFNFLQHFFQAPPLLRKMPLTTNPNLERHGADAIHYTEKDGNKCFILGESKCYESSYKFNDALQTSVDSIVNSFENIDNELILYQHDDFIEPVLKKVATELKEGNIESARFELVCLVAYEETKEKDAPTQEEIEEKIRGCLEYRWGKAKPDLYDNLSSSLIDRIHYVIFPTWSLAQLLKKF